MSLELNVILKPDGSGEQLANVETTTSCVNLLLSQCFVFWKKLREFVS